MKELYNFKNIRGDKFTTILGCIIIIASVVSVFLIPEVTWVDASIGIFIGLSLFPAKINTGGGAAAALLVLMASLLGCTTYNKCYQKYGSLGDTVEVTKLVRIIDTVEVTVAADSATHQMQLDSLLAMHYTDTVKFASANGRAKGKLFKDKKNNYLQASVECPEFDTKVPIDKEVEVKVPCPPPIIFKPEAKKGIKKVWADYKSVAAFLFPLLMIIMCLTHKKQ